MDTLTARIGTVEAALEEAKKPQYPFGLPNGMQGFNVRKGENILSSRGYSLMALAKALWLRRENFPEWKSVAKIELDLSERLYNGYYSNFQQAIGGAMLGTLVPLGGELMPTDTREVEVDEGRIEKVDGLPRDLVEECKQLMTAGGKIDHDEYQWFRKQFPSILRKDLSSVTDTAGGSLRAFESQGELIEHLKHMEVFSRAGARQIDLPPQGRIRFPRQLLSVAIAGYTEGQTVSESTTTNFTGWLTLTAKAYSGLIDIPDELLRFATSVSVEEWLRSEFVREIAIKADADMISGVGSATTIGGAINTTNSRTLVATTTAANGDTLKFEDPYRLYADIADQKTPVDRGFFFSMTNGLWAHLVTEKDSQGMPVHAVMLNQVGGPAINMTLAGYSVFTSTNIPTNRAKPGGDTDLTLLFAGIGPEWIIARAGVVEVAMTNSDASKFAQRISTMRGTQYVDAGPRHEQSFGKIDFLDV